MSTDLTDIDSQVRTDDAWPPAWLMRIRPFAWFHNRFERYVPVAVFAIGFLWDSFTMTRVDNVVDHVILSAYLAALAVMIFHTLRRQEGLARPAWVRRLEPYFLWAMQFAFGGLFSSFVIFYFKSLSGTRTVFFFLLLVTLLVGNEFLHERLENPKLLAALYAFCLFSFLAFFLPTVLHSVDHKIFILAGIISLCSSGAVFAFALRRTSGIWTDSLRGPLAAVGLTILVVNVLYFADLIPPVPLALNNAGIYHNVARVGSGYEVTLVPPPFYRFWRKYDDPFYLAPGEPVYCYTAIFAPAGINLAVRHVWSCYNPGAGWRVTDRIPWQMLGGREGGHRWYTRKTLATPGKWRVEVQTYNGRVLGRIDFTILPAPVPHPSLDKRIIS